MTSDIKRYPRIDEDNFEQNVAKKIAELERRLAQLERAPADDLEIKTTAGDYASGNWDGRRVLNTNDNTYKIYFNSAWQQILP